MLTYRLLLCILASLGSATALHAQSVDLTEAPVADRCFRIVLAMDLAGKIHVKQDGKDLYFAHKAQANHAFVERILDAGKAVRYYTTADSTIAFDNNAGPKRSLREARRFLVAQRVKDQLVSFSPHGPLTRDEIELTDHFDTLAAVGLMPGKTVEVGKSWAIRSSAVLALCELDGVTSHSLQGTLESVQGNRAVGKVAGVAKGINLGAQVEMEIAAHFEFDIKEQRLILLEWKESNKRQQGPITPELKADVTVKLTRTPIAEPKQLDKFALAKVPAADTPPSELTNIRHLDAKNRFELTYGRDWHGTSPEDSPQLVLRNLDRGEFIAQATFTMGKKTDPKSVISLDKFAEEMAKTPGWVKDKEIERKQLKDVAKGHHAVYRVAATGELDGVRTVQYYYLVVGPRGDQLIVTFSVVPQHVERLGVRDLEMVREIVFP